MIALTYVPDLIEGFRSVGETRAKVMGEFPVYPQCSKTKRTVQIIGTNVPGWLNGLCGEYVITSYRKSLELGNYALAFKKLGLSSPLSEHAKLCLSVLGHAVYPSLHMKQTENTAQVLEKEVSIWANQSASASNEDSKASGKQKKR